MKTSESNDIIYSISFCYWRFVNSGTYKQCYLPAFIIDMWLSKVRCLLLHACMGCSHCCEMSTPRVDEEHRTKGRLWYQASIGNWNSKDLLVDVTFRLKAIYSLAYTLSQSLGWLSHWLAGENLFSYFLSNFIADQVNSSWQLATLNEVIALLVL